MLPCNAYIMFKVSLSAKKIFSLFFLSILIWALVSCDKLENPFLEELDNKVNGNSPPETYFFIFFNSDTTVTQDTTWNGDQAIITKDTIITSLDTTASRQEIYWWGDDHDGEVIGYYYQWSYMAEPVFTTAEAGTFYVPIRQKYDRFEFFVQAVDNDSMIDPTPARMSFPVFNSKPDIDFRLNSNPKANPKEPNEISYTFPNRTFIWDATDPDGNETITSILWALDDTSEWNVIEKENNYLTDRIMLTSEHGLIEGFHRFFVKAVDIAGAQSKTIMFPDSTDDEVPNYWYVRPALGTVLLVDDYALGQEDGEVQQFYKDILSDVVEDTFSVWEIGEYNVNTPYNAANTLPYSTDDIEKYFSYFDKVIWFSYYGTHINECGYSITKYIKEGGNIFISNGNKQEPDTTWTFTKIDTTYEIDPDGRLKDVDVIANFGNSELNLKYTLKIHRSLGVRVLAVQPKYENGIDVIYNMQHSDSTLKDVDYIGSPPVCIRYKPEYIKGESIYLSLPLHKCNGYDNVKDLIDYILNVEFE